MKTNTRLIDTKTYVDHDKRSVIVVQKYELDIFAIKNIIGSVRAHVDISQYIYDSIRPTGVFDFKDDKLILVVSGKSKCMPNDNFDEKLGFKIADTRAHVKAMKIFTKFYEGLAELIYDRLLRDIDEKFYYCQHAYCSCKVHEHKLVDL